MSTAIVVIPCHNEARRLPVQAFVDFAAANPGVTFLFSNDGSTDDTARIIDELKVRSPQSFETHHLAKNSGKAEAVRQGMLKAFEGRPEFVGFMDADLATPLDELPAFLELMRRSPAVEWVFGSRVNLLGRSVKRNLLRHYIGRVFATMTCAVLRLGIYDTQCGAKLFRAKPEFRELIAKPFVTNWIFDVELIARKIQAARQGRGTPAESSIAELPLMAWRDVKGSKLKMSDFPKAFVELWRIQSTYMRPGTDQAG